MAFAVGGTVTIGTAGAHDAVVRAGRVARATNDAIAIETVSVPGALAGSCHNPIAGTLVAAGQSSVAVRFSATRNDATVRGAATLAACIADTAPFGRRRGARQTVIGALHSGNDWAELIAEFLRELSPAQVLAAHRENTLQIGRCRGRRRAAAGGLHNRAAGKRSLQLLRCRLGDAQRAELLLGKRERNINIAEAHLTGGWRDHRCDSRRHRQPTRGRARRRGRRSERDRRASSQTGDYRFRIGAQKRTEVAADLVDDVGLPLVRCGCVHRGDLGVQIRRCLSEREYRRARQTRGQNHREKFHKFSPLSFLSETQRFFRLNDNFSRGCAVLEEDALLRHRANARGFVADHFELDLDIPIVGDRFDRLALIDF